MKSGKKLFSILGVVAFIATVAISQAHASGSESGGGGAAVDEKKDDERNESREELRKKMRQKRKISKPESGHESSSLQDAKPQEDSVNKSK